MHPMSITQIELNWLEDHFLFIRTWVLEHQQKSGAGVEVRSAPAFPITGVGAVSPDLERFLLRYFAPISAWITHLESQRIAANVPVISFEDFLGQYDAQNNEN